MMSRENLKGTVPKKFLLWTGADRCQLIPIKKMIQLIVLRIVDMQNEAKLSICIRLVSDFRNECLQDCHFKGLSL